MLRLDRPRVAFLFLVTVFALGAPSLAQPKPGRAVHEDKIDLGYSFKSPDKWDLIPAPPSELSLVCKYAPVGNSSVSLGGSELLFPSLWLLKLDRRAESELSKLDEDASREDVIKAASKRRYKTIEEAIKGIGMDLGRGFELVEEDDFKAGKVTAKEYLYKGKGPGNTGGGKGVEIHAWAIVYPIEEGVDFALLFNAPADSKRWKKWYPSLKKIAKTFKRIEVEKIERVVGSGLRDKKRAALEAKVAGQQGEWSLLETPNYFVLTSVDDKDFVEEMMERLEAIREVYTVDYPLEKALEARKAKERRDAEAEEKRRQERGEEAPADDEARTTAAAADPLEESRTSVVRLCQNKAEYMQYGGSSRSAGYWNWVEEELVIFDDKASGGRKNTWAVLNHEAFHQYIYYFYGNISPHSWYNEGTGDFYSGYQRNRRKKFELERFDWRNLTIQDQIKNEKIVPLKELVRMTQGQYYGNNSIDNGRGSRYPQGWSFIWFLRTGAENRARGWDDSWGGILETYLDALADTGDLDQAVETAFAGVDWDALEESWKTYILKGK